MFQERWKIIWKSDRHEPEWSRGSPLLPSCLPVSPSLPPPPPILQDTHTHTHTHTCVYIHICRDTWEYFVLETCVMWRVVLGQQRSQTTLGKQRCRNLNREIYIFFGTPLGCCGMAVGAQREGVPIFFDFIFSFFRFCFVWIEIIRSVGLVCRLAFWNSARIETSRNVMNREVARP